MTSQELAALPEGARIKLAYHDEDEAGNTFVEYDFGVIVRSGSMVTITWTEVSWANGGFIDNSIIDTKSEHWKDFIADISLAIQSEQK